MSDDDIDKIEAGPELDRMVAEEVMGWTKLRQRRAGEWCGVPPDSEAVYPVKEFSREIAAAWKVVEKMHAMLGGSTAVAIHGATVGWGCRMGVASKIIYGDTAPLAICRAALKAVRSAASDRSRT